MEQLYTLSRIFFPDYCKKCGEYNTLLCTSCALLLPQNIDPLNANCYAALSYRDPTVHSTIVWLKTRNSPDTARSLAIAMVETVREPLSELLLTKNFTNPLVIPIPTSENKMRLHGFNHAETLSREFATILENCEHTTTILFKNNLPTKQAKTKNRSQRFINISRAFYLNNTHELSERCVLLIDDVTTTGATFGAATRILLDAGARHVICVAAAH